LSTERRKERKKAKAKGKIEEKVIKISLSLRATRLPPFPSNSRHLVIVTAKERERERESYSFESVNKKILLRDLNCTANTRFTPSIMEKNGGYGSSERNKSERAKEYIGISILI
jgi:hypothetical protein